LVKRVLKGNPLFSDVAKLTQADHLKSSTISQNIVFPVHELVNASIVLQEISGGFIG
jgi:hypothetical protein